MLGHPQVRILPSRVWPKLGLSNRVERQTDMANTGSGKTMNPQFLMEPCSECFDDQEALRLLEERFDAGTTVRYICARGHLTPKALLTDQGSENTIFGL